MPDLLYQLGIEDIEEDQVIRSLEDIPWNCIKTNLESLGLHDVVKHVQKNTLITKGKNLNSCENRLEITNLLCSSYKIKN